MSKTLLNKGQRTYHTKSGVLAPNETLQVGTDEANDLLGYRDIVELKTKAEAKPEPAEESKSKGETPAKSGKK